MQRWVLMLLSISFLLGACRAPSGVQAPPPEPNPPGMERPVQIYFASARPVLRAPDRLEMVLSMEDLKALAGDSPRAIWIDVGAAPHVDPAWLAERYAAGWPVFLFGEGAYGTLLKLLGDSASTVQPGLAAYRQRGLAAFDPQGVWADVPPVDDLLQISRELITEGEAGIHAVDLASAPTTVRAFAARLGKAEVAQTLVHDGLTYLFLVGGWEVTGTQKVLGGVRAAVQKREGAPHVAAWSLRGTAQPVVVESGDPYLPQVRNRHGLQAAPIDGEAVLVLPVAGGKSAGTLRVAGYIRAFEGSFVVRLKDGAGKEVASAPGQAAGGGPDWGSFVVELPYAGKGKGSLEVWAPSMKDGTEILLARIPVEL